MCRAPIAAVNVLVAPWQQVGSSPAHVELRCPCGFELPLSPTMLAAAGIYNMEDAYTKQATLCCNKSKRSPKVLADAASAPRSFVDDLPLPAARRSHWNNGAEESQTRPLCNDVHLSERFKRALHVGSCRRHRGDLCEGALVSTDPKADVPAHQVGATRLPCEGRPRRPKRPERWSAMCCVCRSVRLGRGQHNRVGERWATGLRPYVLLHIYELVCRPYCKLLTTWRGLANCQF